ASQAREPSVPNDSRSPRFPRVPFFRTPRTRLHGSRPFRLRRRQRVSLTPSGIHAFEAISTAARCLKGTGVKADFHFRGPLPMGGLRFGSLFTQSSKMVQRRSVRRARRETSRTLAGFIVTWDVDSGNLLQCTRVRRFIFGHTVSTNGKTYHYSGFVEHDGVRYLGQSVLFVDREQLDPLRE